MPNYFDDPEFKPKAEPPPAITSYAIVSFLCLPASIVAMLLFAGMNKPSGSPLFGVPGAGAVLFLGVLGVAVGASIIGMVAAKSDKSNHPYSRAGWWLNFTVLTGIFTVLAWMSKSGR